MSKKHQQEELSKDIQQVFNRKNRARILNRGRTKSWR